MKKIKGRTQKESTQESARAAKALADSLEKKKIIEAKKLQLAEEINYLFGELDKKHEKRSAEQLLEFLDFLCQWLSRSSQIIVDAEILYDDAKGRASEEFLGVEEGWNVVKGIIEARVREEKRLFRQADRLNSTMVHTIDAVRSQLSYERNERSMSNFSSSTQRR